MTSACALLVFRNVSCKMYEIFEGIRNRFFSQLANFVHLILGAFVTGPRKLTYSTVTY